MVAVIFIPFFFPFTWCISVIKYHTREFVIDNYTIKSSFEIIKNLLKNFIGIIGSKIFKTILFLLFHIHKLYNTSIMHTQYTLYLFRCMQL